MATLLDSLERLLFDAFRKHNARDHDRFVVAKVTAVDTTNKRATVQIGGDTATTSNIPYLLHYTPAVNDYCVVVIMGSRSYLVIGAVNAVA